MWSESEMARELGRAGLTIDVATYQFFVERFVGHRYEYIIKRRDGREGGFGQWSYCRSRWLSDADLIKHLAGVHIVGTGARWNTSKRRFLTNYFAVDIDFHGDEADLFGRYRAVRDALGLPGLTIRSSESGGVHAYYLLSDAVELGTIRGRSGSSGGVIALLASVGLSEVPGRIEVYPRGHYSEGPQARLRLPFGAGSALLDPYTLEQCSKGGAGDLSILRTQFQAGAIQMHDPAELLIDGPAVASAIRRPTQRPAVAVEASSAEYMAPFRFGLSGRGQLNAAASAFAFDCRSGGLSEADAIQAALRWIDANHNGQSATYNRSPERARAEVAGVVSRVYARSAGVRMPSVPTLSRWEVEYLLAATSSDDCLVDPKTGELLDRYHVQSYGFFILSAAKQWLCWQAERVLSACPATTGRPAGHPPEPAVLGNGLAHCWPEPTKPEFVVPLPDALRKTFRGLPKDGRYPVWRALQHAQLVRLVGLASKSARRAATYAVSLDFGVLSPTPERFSELRAAIRAVYDAGAIDRMYSRTHLLLNSQSTDAVSEQAVAMSSAEEAIAASLAQSHSRRAA